MDVFSDLLDKAQTELDDNRHAESNAAHNFSMLQQSLVVDAAAFSSAEKQELVALVQSRQASDVDDSELSAPAAAVLCGLCSTIVGQGPNSIGRYVPRGVKCSSQFRSPQTLP